MKEINLIRPVPGNETTAPIPQAEIDSLLREPEKSETIAPTSFLNIFITEKIEWLGKWFNSFKKKNTPSISSITKEFSPKENEETIPQTVWVEINNHNYEILLKDEELINKLVADWVIHFLRTNKQKEITFIALKEINNRIWSELAQLKKLKEIMFNYGAISPQIIIETFFKGKNPQKELFVNWVSLKQHEPWKLIAARIDSKDPLGTVLEITGEYFAYQDKPLLPGTTRVKYYSPNSNLSE